MRKQYDIPTIHVTRTGGVYDEGYAPDFTHVFDVSGNHVDRSPGSGTKYDATMAQYLRYLEGAATPESTEYTVEFHRASTRRDHEVAAFAARGDYLDTQGSLFSRDQRLAEASAILRRRVESFSDLTADELDALTAWYERYVEFIEEEV